MAENAPPPPPIVAPAIQSASDGRFIAAEIATPQGPRRYKIYIPAGYDKTKPLSLVVVLHGCTQDADDVARATQFNTAADEATVLVAYPEQPASANGLKCWNWFEPAHQKRGAGEPALIAAITQRVMADYSVDPTRVYLVGLSAGGAMALAAAYSYPELYAAIGVHSGIALGVVSSGAEAIKAMSAGASDSVLRSAISHLRSAPPIPAIVFQGKSDRVVNPVNASQVVEQLLGIPTAVARCAPETISGETAGGYHFTKRLHRPGKSAVEEWIVDELGHAWSGGSKEGTYADPRGPDATREMLRFFREHPRN